MSEELWDVTVGIGVVLETLKWESGAVERAGELVACWGETAAGTLELWGGAGRYNSIMGWDWYCAR